MFTGDHTGEEPVSGRVPVEMSAVGATETEGDCLAQTSWLS